MRYGRAEGPAGATDDRETIMPYRQTSETRPVSRCCPPVSTRSRDAAGVRIHAPYCARNPRQTFCVIPPGHPAHPRSR